MMKEAIIKIIDFEFIINIVIPIFILIYIIFAKRKNLVEIVIKLNCFLVPRNNNWKRQSNIKKFRCFLGLLFSFFTGSIGMLLRDKTAGLVNKIIEKKLIIYLLYDCFISIIIFLVFINKVKCWEIDNKNLNVLDKSNIEDNYIKEKSKSKLSRIIFPIIYLLFLIVIILDLLNKIHLTFIYYLIFACFVFLITKTIKKI